MKRRRNARHAARKLWAILLVFQLVAPPRPAAAAATDGSTLPAQRGLARAETISPTAEGVDLASGAATWSVPIEVPPGTGGMTPELALRYSSAARQDSWVGYGWTLGLPSIGRSLKHGTPSYDDDLDIFALAGEELVAEAPSGPLPRRYHTRRESFMEIVHEADDTWTLRRRDGVVLRFGVGSDARVERSPGEVFEWLLSEQEDADGNVIAVAYEDGLDPGTHYPAELRYTLRRTAQGALQSLDGDPARDRVVSFVLEPRPDQPVSFLAGFERRLGHRLARIDVLVPTLSPSGGALGPVLLRRYELGYTTSPDSLRSLLASVALFGSDADAPTPTPPLVTSFTYHSNVAAGTTGWEPASFAWPAGLSLVDASRRDMGVRLGDVDGDGRTDLLKALVIPDVANPPDPLSATFHYGPGSGVYLNGGVGFESVPSSSLPESDSEPLVGFAIDLGSAGIHSTGTTVLDVTGDGRVDIVAGQRVLVPTQGGMLVADPWFVGTANGFSQVGLPQDLATDVFWGVARFGLVSASPGLFGTTPGNVRFSDLTGDGLPELVVRGHESYLYFGPYFPTTPYFSQDRSNYYYDNLGDLQFERADLVEPPPTLPGWYFSSVRVAHDFQHCDIGQSWQLCGFRIAFNGTFGQRDSTNADWYWRSSHEQGVMDVDLNGDGLADTISATTAASGASSTAYLNNGRRGYSELPGWAPPSSLYFFSQVAGSLHSEDLGIRLADLNGDARVDLVRGKPGVHGTWLNDGDVEEGGAAAAWVTNVAWQLPAGFDFVDASGLDLGVRLEDLDGDGMTDLVRSFGGTNEVWLNRGEVPDLLTSATTPLGAVTSFAYAPSTDFGNGGDDGAPDLPQVIPVVVSIEVDDANGSTSTRSIHYAGGLFDAAEREFRGFQEVIVTEEAGSATRRTQTLFHQDTARAGLVESEVVFTGADVVTGSCWSATSTTYTEPGASPPFVSLPRSVLRAEYDGLPCDLSAGFPRWSRTDFSYDFDAGGPGPFHGNLIDRLERGAVNPAGTPLEPSKQRRTVFAWAPPPAGSHLVSRPASEQVWRVSPQAGLLAETRLSYEDPAHPARVTRRVDVLDLGAGTGPTTTFAHDAYGNVVEILDPLWNAGQGGARTVIEYDALVHAFPFGRVNNLGQRTQLGYAAPSDCSLALPAAAGLVHQEWGPNDLAALPLNRRLRCHDAFGRPVLDRASGDLAETTWAYDDTPGAARVVEARRASAAGGLRTTTSHVDGLGRAVRVESSGPQSGTVVVERSFDLLGRLASETDPTFLGDASRVTTFAHDPLDRPVSVTLPGSGRLHTTSYDRGVVTTTDPNGAVRQRTVDAFGNVVRVEEVAPGGPFVTTYSYDRLGRLTRVTDAGGNVTEIDYDPLGRRTRLADPDAGETLYTYDLNGNLTEEESPLDTTLWTYDALGRPATRRLASALFPLPDTWRYDSAPGGIGLLASREDGTGTYLALVYDALGRPTSERRIAGGRRHVVETAYDPLGQVASRHYPAAGRSIAFERDAAGHLTAIRSGPDDVATGIAWDAAGRLLAWTAGSGVATTRSFDPATGRLESIRSEGATLLEHLAYDYDPGDRITAIDDLRDPGLSRDFAYDALDRLSEASGPYAPGLAAATLQQSYDPLGNLLCKDASSLAGCAGGTAFSYPAPGPGVVRPHAPVSVGGQTAGYDAAGNLTALGARSYAYTGHGELREVRQGGTTQATYAYDGAGRRTRIFEGSAERWLLMPDLEWRPAAGQARLVVPLAGAVVATLDVPYAPPANSVCGLGFELAPLLVGLAALAARRRRRGCGGRAILALTTAGAFLVVSSVPLPLAPASVARAAAPAGTRFHHGDHLGSVVLVTDAAGAVVERAVYRPFGARVPESAGGSTDAPAFGFTGQRFEAVADLYDYGARFYDPALGRFLQPDPVVEDPYQPQTLNAYSYVRNAPTLRTDPTGGFSMRFGGGANGGWSFGLRGFAGFIDSYGFTGVGFGYRAHRGGLRSFSGFGALAGIPFASFRSSRSSTRSGAAASLFSGRASVSQERGLFAGRLTVSVNGQSSTYHTPGTSSAFLPQLIGGFVGAASGGGAAYEASDGSWGAAAFGALVGGGIGALLPNPYAIAASSAYIRSQSAVASGRRADAGDLAAAGIDGVLAGVGGAAGPEVGYQVARRAAGRISPPFPLRGRDAEAIRDHVGALAIEIPASELLDRLLDR